MSSIWVWRCDVNGIFTQNDQIRWRLKKMATMWVCVCVCVLGCTSIHLSREHNNNCIRVHFSSSFCLYRNVWWKDRKNERQQTNRFLICLLSFGSIAIFINFEIAVYLFTCEWFAGICLPMATMALGITCASPVQCVRSTVYRWNTNRFLWTIILSLNAFAAQKITTTI